MTIIKRTTLGRPLTWAELDNNFEQVDSLVQQSSEAVNTATTAAQQAQSAAATAGVAVDAFKQDLASTSAGKGASLVKLQNGHTVQDKANSYPDALDKGAVGDGITDDYVKYSLVETESDPLYLPQNKNFNIGNHVNQSKVWGPGSVTINSVKFDKVSFRYDIKSDSLLFTPPSYYTNFGDFPGSTGKSNILVSPGTNAEGKINRSTIVGTNNLTKVISVDRTDIFGNGSFQFMRYGERNTAVGTIVGQWLGTNDPAGDGHEMWANAGGFIPGQPGWNYSGFETANPGIGAKIAAFNTFATQSSDVSSNVGIGRDAFNAGVTLNNCTCVGYRAGASFFAASNMTAIGTDSYRSGLFLTNSVAVGYASGNAWQEGTRNTVIGHQAGYSSVKGDENTLLGSFAGSSFTAMNNNIFIGVGAGNDLQPTNPTPMNLLAIGNDVTGVGAPLIVGNMASPKLGINILPEKLSGTLHVRTSDQTTSPVAPSGSADDVVIESSGNTGITLRSGASSLATVAFSSPTVAVPGSLSYNHSTSSLVFRAASADRWQVQANSLNPIADNVYSLGTSALRASTIYAGTGAISTSDMTLKTSERDIDDAEIATAKQIKSEIKIFKFKDAVSEKGEDSARWHCGVMAQRVAEIFLENGLSPEKYGLFCYDKWDEIPEENDEEGNVITPRVEAGERYGIRYDELAMFIIAAL